MAALPDDELDTLAASLPASLVDELAAQVLRRAVLHRAEQLAVLAHGRAALAGGDDLTTAIEQTGTSTRRCSNCHRLLGEEAFGGMRQCIRCRERKRVSAARRTRKPRRAASNGSSSEPSPEPEPEPARPSHPEHLLALTGARGPRAQELAAGARQSPSRVYG